jgi:fumarate reductase flavoprotein subunit
MKKLATDIVVISAGTAGLAATVTAAEAGAKVIAFEKMGHTGGTANMGSAIFAVESSLQKIKQMQLTREEIFSSYMRFTHWRVNARLVKTLIDRSAESVDWLCGLGVRFFDVTAHGEGNYHTMHIVEGPEMPEKRMGRGTVMMTKLAERAKTLSVPIYLKTPVQKILKENGRIAGVIVKDEAGEVGEEIHVTAKAVIVATGGHSIGMLPGNIGVIGDGVRMAKEVGAIVKEISNTKSEDSSMPPRRGGRFPGFSASMFAFQQPVLIVNRLGERFMNEEILPSVTFASEAIKCQPDGVAFVMFDEDTKELFKKQYHTVPGGAQQPYPCAPNIDAELKEMLEQDPDSIIVADSVEEICSRTGIDPEGFRQTLEEYNRACDTGRDEAFGKRVKYLKPFRRSPFYVSRHRRVSSVQWSGIKVNYKTEVIDTNYRVIPGLYAVGMDIASEFYYDTYPLFIPATAMGFAIQSGRLAAENAVKYVQ